MKTCRPAPLYRLAPFAAVAVACALAGCAGPRAGYSGAEQLLPEIDIIQLRDDATKALEESRAMRSEIERLSARVRELESRSASAPAQALPAPRTPPSPPPQTPAAPPAMIPFDDLSAQSPSPPQSPPPTGKTDAQFYQDALDTFNKRDYTNAAALFRRVIAMNESGSYAENARYWVGECLYAQGNFEQALSEFRTVAAPPVSGKDDDAQLKIGLCLVKLDRNAEARAAFETLIRQFADSEYVSRARSYLERLR